MSNRMNCPACGADNPAVDESLDEPARCVECDSLLVFSGTKKSGPPPAPGRDKPSRLAPNREEDEEPTPSGKTDPNNSLKQVLLVLAAMIVFFGFGAGTTYSMLKLVIDRSQPSVTIMEASSGGSATGQFGPKPEVNLAPQIAALNLREQSPPTDADDQITLGNDWSDLADKAKGAEKSQAFRRMHHWYRLAFPSLKDAERRRVARRMSLGVSDVERDDSSKNQFTLYAGKWRVGYEIFRGTSFSRDYLIQPDGQVSVTASTDGRTGQKGMLVRKDGFVVMTWADGKPSERALITEDTLSLFPHPEKGAPDSPPTVAKVVYLRPETDDFKNPTGAALVFKPYKSALGNCSITFPGSPRASGSKTPKTGKEFGTATLENKDALYSLRYDAYPGERTENELFDSIGLKILARDATSKKELTFGDHPGIEFTADKTNDGQMKNVRGRIIAVKNKLYQISIVSAPDQKIPEEWVAHFFKSFRLIDEPDSVFAEAAPNEDGDWKEIRSTAGNYLIELPGKATESVSKFKSTGQVATSARVVDDKGTEFVFRSITAFSNLPEAALLENAIKQYAKFATEKKPLKMGDYSGIEFTADKSLIGMARNIRSRVFVVKDRVYELSISARPDVKVSEEAAERFFKSFRLIDENPAPKSVEPKPKE
ncbi:hypothetical protein [Zavarzinella formosa]|uniref:hypothetical protein n=1 Tax=Zavarzinella formosa TaxID=360055 RepID=UPI0002EE8AEC|nr:hypothetical protein [Zavarzinella formosa]